MLKYKIGFWILVVVLVICCIIAYHLFEDRFILRLLGILDSRDVNIVDKLPYKYYKDAKTLTYSYDKHVQSIDDFEKWKNLAISKYSPSFVDRANYDDIVPELILTKDKDGYTIEKYSIPSSGENDGLFYKLVPDVKSDKALLVLSGTGDQGFNDVIGEPSKWSWHYYQSEIGKKLVLEGYTIYAPEWYGAGERGVKFKYCTYIKPLDCNNHLFVKMLNHYNISVINIRIDDLYRITSIINSEFDRVGAVGLSLGGTTAIQTSILNPDVYDVVASASGELNIHDHYAYLQYENAHSLVYSDFGDDAILIAPRPFYLSFGILQPSIGAYDTEINSIFNYIREAYKLHGYEENFVSIIHKGGHEYDVKSLVKFLNDYL